MLVHDNLNKQNAFVIVTIEMPDSLFGSVCIPYTWINKVSSAKEINMVHLPQSSISPPCKGISTPT